MDAGELLRLDGVAKTYGAVRALRDVSFSVAAGEVHAILGENGAGKSTLMRIISGSASPSAGEVRFEGKPVGVFSPAYARDLGIAMVHQELAVFPDLSVAENIFPDGIFRRRFGLCDWGRTRDHARAALDRFDVDIDVDAPVSELTLGQRQIVEILRAVSRDNKIVILDEPTSGLSSHEARILMEMVKTLRARGQTILYISHRLSEVVELGDRITVLRDGCSVETVRNDALSENDLAAMMVGRDIGSIGGPRPRRVLPAASPAFEARALAGRAVADVDIALRRGEILGVFGLEGSGVAELMRLLFGLDPASAGEIAVGGETVDRVEPRAMIDRGVGYLAQDRKAAGLYLGMAASESISAAVLDRLSPGGFVSRRRVDALAGQAIRDQSIRIASPQVQPRRLSGGNQQKVMIAACLAPEPDVLLVNDPTRGIDVGTKAEIHRRLIAMSESGRSMIVASAELPELVAICDRILVMRRQRMAGYLEGAEISEEAVMRLAAGGLH